MVRRFSSSPTSVATAFDPRPHLSSLGEEVVVRVDDEQCGRVLLVDGVAMVESFARSIVSVEGSRRAAAVLQRVGAQHIYLEFPGKDHEFWIRRGPENMEKVFLFFATVSKHTHR